MPVDSDLPEFARLIQALRSSLKEIVIIGGWAHRLYRYRANAEVPPYSPLFTADTDIAIPSRISRKTHLRDELLASGFIEEFIGDDDPPVTHYRLGDETSAFYAEFVTPLIGGGGRWEKSSQHTAQISGVTAQKLRHLEILLIEPWSIKLPPGFAGVLGKSANVRVANAVCYIAQKMLINEKRKSADRAKDVLYIHDTVELLGSSLDELRTLWQKSIRPNLAVTVSRRVEKLSTDLFAEVTDDTREAAVVAAGRNLPAETIRLLCEIGLREIFGG